MFRSASPALYWLNHDKRASHTGPRRSAAMAAIVLHTARLMMCMALAVPVLSGAFELTPLTSDASQTRVSLTPRLSGEPLRLPLFFKEASAPVELRTICVTTDETCGSIRQRRKGSGLPF